MESDRFLYRKLSLIFAESTSVCVGVQPRKIEKSEGQTYAKSAGGEYYREAPALLSLNYREINARTREELKIVILISARKSADFIYLEEKFRSLIR